MHIMLRYFHSVTCSYTIGLNNMYDYDYDITSLKADIESLSGSLSRLEYEIQEIKYRIQQLESDIDETKALSEHYNY